jgi:hypothetical protein
MDFTELLVVFLLMIGIGGLIALIAMRYLTKQHDQVDLPVKCSLCKKGEAVQFVFNASPFHANYQFLCADCGMSVKK